MNEDIYSKQKRSKKYLLTFTEETHAEIRNQLRTMTRIIYWCMCDDLGSVEGSTVVHTHLFVSFQSGVSMAYMKDMFPTAVIVSTSCSYRDARDYVLGKVIFFEGDEALCKEDVFEEYYAFEEEASEPQKEVPEPQPHFIGKHSTVIPWLIMLIGLLLAVMIGCMRVNAQSYEYYLGEYIHKVCRDETETYGYKFYRLMDMENDEGLEYAQAYNTATNIYVWYVYAVNPDFTPGATLYDDEWYIYEDGTQKNNYTNTRTFDDWNDFSKYTSENGDVVYYSKIWSNTKFVDNDKYSYDFNPLKMYYYSNEENFEAFYEDCISLGLEPDEKEQISIYDLPQDTSYKLTGFTADNNIDAFWTGTTDSAVISENKYVSVTFAYASKDFPGISDGARVYESLFPFEDFHYFIDWYEVQPDDDSQYLLFMRVYPIGITTDGNYCKGDDSTLYYNIDGSVSSNSANKNTIDSIYDDITHGGGGSQEGTEYLSDFYLRNVVLKNGFINSKDVVQWSGCTNNTEYLTIPDSDTLVICTLVLYDSNYDYVVEYYDSTTIGSSSLVVDWQALNEKYLESEYYWAGEIRLTPSYKIDNKLHIGQQTVINMFDLSVKNEGVDSDGNFIIEDVTDSNISDSNKDSIFDNAADYLNDSEALEKYTSLFFGFLTNLVSLMGDLPNIFAAVFSFLPSFYSNLIGMIFVIALVCRFLGR